MDSPEIKVFLSYARADEDAFHVVRPFVDTLTAVVRAKSGRRLDVFVDQVRIGWGENWRDRLDESIRGATVFIPLLSATYLERPACRQELLAFHSKASVLGVTELLLPVLLFHSSVFSADSEDEVVKIAESLQWRVIEPGILAGYGSPAWVTLMAGLADDLLRVLGAAESLLGEVPLIANHREGPVASEARPKDALLDEEPGLVELAEQMGRGIDEMTAAAEALGSNIQLLGEAAGATPAPSDGAAPKDFMKWTILAANRMQGPAQGVNEHGRALLDAVQLVDDAIQKLRVLSTSLPGTDFSDQINSGIARVASQIGDLGEVGRQMEDLMVSMRPAEALSVPIRKSLKPARQGLVAVKDSFGIVSSW